eukprot:1143320-Pelagomonas_calceolata.AAC.1
MNHETEDYSYNELDLQPGGLAASACWIVPAKQTASTSSTKFGNEMASSRCHDFIPSLRVVERKGKGIAESA